MISRIFLTDIDKFLHHSRRPAVFFQARRILVVSFSSSMIRMGRSVQRSSMDLGKTAVARLFLHPEHGISGIVADTENIRLEIFFLQRLSSEILRIAGK